MPTSELFFYISPGLVLFAGDFFLPKLIISWTDLGSWKKIPVSHFNKPRHPEHSSPTPGWEAKELCETYWPTECRFNRQERLHMINCSYLYLWVWLLSMSGLSPFYFIIFPLLETEEQKLRKWKTEKCKYRLSFCLERSTQKKQIWQSENLFPEWVDLKNRISKIKIWERSWSSSPSGWKTTGDFFSNFSSSIVCCAIPAAFNVSFANMLIHVFHSIFLLSIKIRLSPGSCL